MVIPMVKKRKLFVDDGSSHGTVILNWRGKPEEEFPYMAEAFRDAANDATRKLKRNKHFGIHGIPMEDFRAYPVIYLYLYRHALELSMKAVLIVYEDAGTERRTGGGPEAAAVKART